MKDWSFSQQCGSCKNQVVTGTTWHNIPEDGILPVRFCEHSKVVKKLEKIAEVNTVLVSDFRLVPYILMESTDTTKITSIMHLFVGTAYCCLCLGMHYQHKTLCILLHNIHNTEYEIQCCLQIVQIKVMLKVLSQFRIQ
jgi:hypothetical protein